jgi:hypothetical protein
MIERLNWKMLWNGNDFGKKTKVMINSEQPSSVQIMIYQNNWRKWPISDIWGA